MRAATSSFVHSFTCSLALRRFDELDFEGDGHVFADQDTAGFKG
jgi:hypothetical protein